MNTAQWIKEAEEQAKKYSDNIKTSNQYILDQLMESKNNTLAQLQKQQDNALYNINSNKSNINATAEENARQANINRLLALKSNEQAMNRAGLGTQGIVGSQVNSINSDYGNNLTAILNEKVSGLRDLQKQTADTNLNYDNSRLDLENKYSANYADLQGQINDKALNQYNAVYQNYLAMKQQEYENQQAELARQEAIRQYNENLALQKAQLEYQRQQDAIANAQRWAQINASNDNSGFGEGGNSTSETYVDTSNYYTSPADIVKALGLSLAGDFQSYIDKDYIDEIIINGKTYYAKGSKTPSSSNSSKTSSSNNKKATNQNIYFGTGNLGADRLRLK